MRPGDPNGIWTRDNTVTGYRDDHFTIGSRWEEQDLNLWRQSRLIYSQIPLTTRKSSQIDSVELRRWGALDLPQESVSKESNGFGRDRTDDLQVKSPLLYLLSYKPINVENIELSMFGVVSQPLV